MKKKLAMMLLTVMAVSLVACGSQDDTNTNDNVNNETNVEESAPEGTVEDEATNEGDAEIAPEENAGDVTEGTTGVGAVAVFDTILPGFLAEMEVVFDGPADGYFGYMAYEKTTAEDMDAMLAFPAAEYDKVGDVAYMMHMMNANNLTAAVYQLNNADDAQAVADAIKDNVMNRQWICGFPEKLIVLSFDEYVVAAYGNTAVIDGMKTSFESAYENATLLYEENL